MIRPVVTQIVVLKPSHITVVKTFPRSRRIQTRTKGKRAMKRARREAADRMAELIAQTEWGIFAYTARGLYP